MAVTKTGLDNEVKGTANPAKLQPDVSWQAPSVRRRSLEALLACNQRLFWIHFSEATKRCFDLTVAAILVVLLAPALVAALLVARLTGGGLRWTERLGRAGKSFQEFSFQFGPTTSGNSFLRRVPRKLPVLFNVLKGDMSLVGPRPFAPCEVGAGDRFAWRRFDVRPGLICLWWIRRRANIAYRTETETDAEYVDQLSTQRDLGIMLRSIPVSFYGENSTAKPGSLNILGIPIHNVTMQEAVSRIIEYSYSKTPAQVCFVNADCANISFRDSYYKAILFQAGLVLADGIGMKLAGKILKKPVCQNVNGTDLLPELCVQLAAQNRRLYLVGGKPGTAGQPSVAADVASWIQQNHPGVVISGHSHGYLTEGERSKVLTAIRQSEANVLLVAMGAPVQEKWIFEFLPQTGCSVALGVGGLFDFYAGRIPRAPIWVREIGMEWLFRFVQEPRRMWKRYFTGNFLFLGRVLFARWAKPTGRA